MRQQIFFTRALNTKYIFFFSSVHFEMTSVKKKTIASHMELYGKEDLEIMQQSPYVDSRIYHYDRSIFKMCVFYPQFSVIYNKQTKKKHREICTRVKYIRVKNFNFLLPTIFLHHFGSILFIICR